MLAIASYKYSMQQLLVRSGQIYAAVVWDPYCAGNVSALEKVQKFALKVCTGCWSCDYSNLLHQSQLPSLSKRRKYIRLCTFFKLLQEPSFSQVLQLVPRHPYPNRSHMQTYIQPFAHKDSFLYSFIPRTTNEWNQLPEDIVSSSSFITFKLKLKAFIFYN